MATPTLVTIHGLGLDAASFAPMLERLRTPFAVHGVDLPGFGAARDERWTSVDAIAHDVTRRIRAAVGEGPWMLLGHSMGGRIASIVAALLRDEGGPMPAGIVLLAPSPVTREPMAASKRAEMLGWARSGQIDADAARAFVDANVGAALPPDLDALALAAVQASAARSWIGWLESGSREDWSDDVRSLDVPTVIVAGEADDDLGAAAQPRLTSPTHPYARLAALPGVGHLVALERPAEAAEAIDALWDETRGQHRSRH